MRLRLYSRGNLESKEARWENLGPQEKSLVVYYSNATLMAKFKVVGLFIHYILACSSADDASSDACAHLLHSLLVYYHPPRAIEIYSSCMSDQSWQGTVRNRV
jgi:hypothetical protein